jgi:hypothetical protein
MSYIGNKPTIGNFQICDAISVVNGQAAYTMQVGSVNVTPQSANHMIVSLNGTIQKPNSSFTVSGSTITFASNLATGDVIDFIQILGDVLDLGVPSDATVTTAKLASDSVTSAKVADGVLQPPHRNIIINGDMSVAQRGTSTASITSYGYYTVDRFQLAPNTMGTWTMSQSTDVPTGQGFSNSLKIDCTTADASPSAGDNLTISSNFEGQMLQYLKKGTSSAESLTLSFWIKTNKTGTYIAELYDNDNTRTINKSFTVSSADTWEKKEITYAGDTTGAFGNDANNSLGVNFWLGSGTTYTSGTLQTSWGSRVQANRAVGVTNLADSTSNELYLTGVQLEVGTAASDFEFLPVDVNLQRCRRYFQKNDIWLSDGGYNFMKFYYTPMYLLPNMRTSPSLYDSTDWNSDSGDGGTVTTSGTNKVGIAIDQTCPTNVVLKGADHNGSYREIKGRVHINAEL